MFEEIKIWFRKDKYNIFLTILCALLSMAPSWWRYVALFLNWGEAFHGETVLTMGIFVLACVGMWLLSTNFRPAALNGIRDKQTFKDYIEDVCGIKQTRMNDSERAYKVVKGTVWQFFVAWQIIWLLWIIYYGIETIQSVCHFDENVSCPIQVLKYFIDFITSAALFSVYFILNNVTVNIRDRAPKYGYGVLKSIASCVILFGAFVVLQIFYLSGFPSKVEIFNVYTKLLLGFFSTISFVLVLGKLNSSYLLVPRMLMMLLYIYAVFQIFSSLESVGDKKDMKDALANLLIIRPWVILFGKTALLMTLSWILYKKRLIFYIVHESLSLTENSSRLNKFNRYMSD